MKKLKIFISYLKVVCIVYAIQSFCLWQINLFQFIPKLEVGERFGVLILYIFVPIVIMLFKIAFSNSYGQFKK